MQVRPNVHYVRPSPVENGYLSHGSLKLSYRRQSHSKTLTSMPGSARKHFPRLPPKFRPLLMRLRKPLPQETLLQKWRQYAAQGRLGSTSLRQVNTPEMPATRVDEGCDSPDLQESSSGQRCLLPPRFPVADGLPAVIFQTPVSQFRGGKAARTKAMGRLYWRVW